MVKQEPVLTNFPSHVFATARRKFQAGIRRLRESLIAESLSGYSMVFADVLPAAFLQSWCRSQDLPVPSSDTSSYCKARSRLSNAFLSKVAQRVDESLAQGQLEVDLWHGFTLNAVDGTTVKLADT